MRAGGGGIDLLGVFPSFDSKYFGGVQASGREAWKGISNLKGTRARAFYYEPDTSKMLAAARALSRRRSVDTLLAWHLGLLKLSPFLVSSRRRTVVFLHGVEAWKRHDRFTSLLLEKTDLFLANSKHTWNRFLKFHEGCSNRPHRTVHLGLGQGLCRAPGLPDRIPAALMIGRLSRDEDYKGHRETIRVWPRIVECLPGAELWIVGGGDLRPQLESMAAELGCGAHVKFFGAAPEGEKQDLLRRSRAFLLPSRGEGFGLAYLEAMRMGRPCLVSGFDAGTEVVNPPEAGLAADPGDPGCLANAILRLLTPGPEWDRMSAGARSRYQANFTSSHFTRRLLSALFDE